MSLIQSIHAYQIIDSRGFPTIEGVLTLDNGVSVVSSVPTSNTTGKFESYQLRDNDLKKFEGMGVSIAVAYINDLVAPKLKGASPTKQQEIDNWLIKADATKDKRKLGSNSLLLISQLIAKAVSVDQKIPLYKYSNSLYNVQNKDNLVIENIPSPIFNLINGGKHASSNLEFQEYQIIASSANNFAQAYEKGLGVFHELKRVLQYRSTGVSVGEEGGLTPNLSSNLDALEILAETVRKKDIRLGLDIFLGVNMASSFFYKSDRYNIKDKPHPLNREELIGYVLNMAKLYPLLILEDPISENDWSGWKSLNATLPASTYLVGNDLICSNKDRLLSAIKNTACSAISIKPIQIGTITETFELVALAKKNKISYIVSATTGETSDTFIADLSVAIQTDFVNFGAPSRGERVEKYNRLWNIERERVNG